MVHRAHSHGGAYHAATSHSTPTTAQDLLPYPERSENPTAIYLPLPISHVALVRTRTGSTQHSPHPPLVYSTTACTLWQSKRTPRQLTACRSPGTPPIDEDRHLPWQRIPQRR
ncbi:unnamed protein product [Ectocarpus fasciculatus]